MDNPLIEKAASNDLPALAALLDQTRLPSEDIGEHVENFFVARWEGKILGTIGAELHGDDALLRSLAVVDSERNKGIGDALVRRLLAHLKTKEIRRVALLTTTAERYFAKRGFRQVQSELVPPFVKSTKEFQRYCPATAVCMVASF
jgi:amino-acid N-acetyltransferase